MKKFHRSIFFTKVPLGGYYKYRDQFQVFPADLADMPFYSHQRHYPNILEYWTTDEETIVIDTEYEELKELYSKMAPSIKKQNQILNLLSSFSNNLFFYYT